MALVERISHRVAVMYLGEIVEIGPRRAVFENPQHEYTKRLMAAVPVADPSRRRTRLLSNDEIKSPWRPADYLPPQRSYHEVDQDHWILRQLAKDRDNRRGQKRTACANSVFVNVWMNSKEGCGAVCSL